MLIIRNLNLISVQSWTYLSLNNKQRITRFHFCKWNDHRFEQVENKPFLEREREITREIGDDGK